jgi:glycosyltransferase involved in cell wall biosynthesis
MKISVCVPTFRKDYKPEFDFGGEIIVSGQEGSAAYNRNYCLDKATGDVIVMIDDDITGFYSGWVEDLVKPLEDNSISIVSARLLNKDGTNAPMMYDGQPQYKIVPSSCVAFRKTPIRFDEGYVGGFEDTDFCKQMDTVHPDKKVLVNEKCRLIHLNEKKRQENYANARRYFVSKWGWVHQPKKPLATIIYYTASKEKEAFEKSVTDQIIRAKGTLPIISVSQKPLDFGKNICVGEMPHCYESAFKQVKIGCEAADTEYVIMTESDVLYPEKGYFDFIPTDPTVVYTYDNVWMLWNRINRTRFYKHGTTAGSIILSRKYYLERLKDNMPNFQDPKIKWVWFSGEPMINVKTRQGVSFGTTLTPGVKPVSEFPYWGTVEDVKRNYKI